MDLQVGILQVAVRTTNNGRQIFDVSCSDGKTRAVWEAALANGINAFAGSGATITIRVRVSQKGQYTNESITAFAPPGQALPPEAEGGGTGGGGGFRRGGGGMSPDDKTRIAKMGAQGSASTLVAALFAGAGPEAYDEAVSLFDKLTRKLYTDARSHEKPGGGGDEQSGTVLQPGATVGAAQADTTQGAVLQPGATAADVAAAVPGVQLGAQVLPAGGAADAAAAADVQAQNATEQGDNIQWN